MKTRKICAGNAYGHEQLKLAFNLLFELPLWNLTRRLKITRQFSQYPEIQHI